jgi:hypothetical protein
MFGFLYFYIPIFFITSIFRIRSAITLILREAEAKGWKNIKVKLRLWDYLVTYQDENGEQHTTQCTADNYRILWINEAHYSYLDLKTYQAKSKNWKIISTVCGICFLFLFTAYQYQQISWNLFRKSFVENGYAVRIKDNRFVVGLESILRGEEALKIIDTLDLNLEPPQEDIEHAIIKLKIKNISKQGAESLSLLNVSATSDEFFFPLLPLKGLPEYSDPIKLNGGEVSFNSFLGELPTIDPIKKLRLSYDQSSEMYIIKGLPLSQNPFDNDIILFVFMILWINPPVLIQNKLFKRWYLLLRSKKTRGYVLFPMFIPLLSIVTIFASYGMELTQAFFFHLIMIALFTITWWNIILLASTKPEN